MNTRLRTTTFLCLLISTLLLAGCSPNSTSFSPQQASIHALTTQSGPENLVDQNTIIVHQTVSLNQKAFVMISYTQTETGQKMDCTSVFINKRNGLGIWAPEGSGGGCTAFIDGQALPKSPFDFGAGTSGSGNPADPGVSYAYGKVNQADIVKVRVTWEKGQIQEVSVINNSYLAIREGQNHPSKLEGLNASGEIVHRFETMPAPGKW